MLSYFLIEMKMTRILFYFAVMCSLLSQIPSFLDKGYDSYLKLSWMLPFTFLFLINPKDYISKELISFYAFLFVFFLYCSLCEVIYNVSYIGADLNNIGISFFVLIVSFNFWRIYGSQKVLRNISFLVLLSSLLLSYIVYTGYLSNYSIFEKVYAYSSKNSLGQIILSSAILAFVLYKPSKLLIKIPYYISIVYIIIIVFILKSRATIACVFFVTMYYVLFYKDRRIRIVFIGALTAIVVYVLKNPWAYDAIVNAILLGNRDASDLDDVSSGRLTLMRDCLALIEKNPLTGNGNYYFDCFPLVMIAQYGIIGAFFVFFFLANKIAFCIKKLDRKIGLDLALFLLFFSFLINSLFEAQPPFGPGVKCFQLWMTFGFVLASHSKRTIAHDK